jgi:hypothetical protein
MSINFELYSRAVSAIEQQLLNGNSDTFTEKNDSYEINENYSDMIDDLNNLEQENVDYVMVLEDIRKAIEYRFRDEIVDNYERLLTKNFYLDENEEILKEQIEEGKQNFLNKLKDMNIFLKEMNSSSVKKQNKLSYLKIIVNKLESNFKILDEDYRNLFQKLNMNQPVEISDETERLLEENSYLTEQKELKDHQIDLLNKQIDEKDEQLFILQSKVDKLVVLEIDANKEKVSLKNELQEMKKAYDALLNDIYEKIKKEEESAGKNQKNSENLAGNNINKNSIQDKDTIMKYRDKILLNDDNKKIAEMNYEQLLLYTLEPERLNKLMEDKNKSNEKKIKDMDTELQKLNKVIAEHNKNIHLLKSENSRLQNKISDINKDIELNSVFRPSNALNRISVMNRKSNIGGGNISSFTYFIAEIYTR